MTHNYHTKALGLLIAAMLSLASLGGSTVLLDVAALGTPVTLAA